MSDFAVLAQTFLDDTFHDSPVLASQLGVDGYDDRLDDLSETAFNERSRRSAAWLDRFDHLDDSACSTFDEQLDRDLIRSTLRGRAILEDWQLWRRQPETYLNPGLGGIFSLFLHRLKPEPQLVTAAVARLRDIPKILEDGRHNLKPELAPRLFVERAIRQARSGARYLSEILPAEVQDNALRGQLADWGGIAGGAMHVYAEFLESTLLPKASGDYVLGAERYSRLLREKEPTPTTAQAAFLFALLVFLNWMSLNFGQQVSIVTHTAVRMLAFVAAPPLLMTMLLNTRPGQGLGLRWPKWQELGLAAILAVLLLPPLAAVTELVFKNYPHLTRLLEDRQPLIQELRALSEGQPLQQEKIFPYMLVFALLPALCEEIAFRGFILSGMLKRFRPRTAVLLTSFLFALFHMNVFQILPAFFLGVVLGLLTIRSRSLLPAILFHFLHNTVLIGGIHLVAGLDHVAPDFVKHLWYPFITGCLVLALGILWWLYRKPYVDLERELALAEMEERA